MCTAHKHVGDFVLILFFLFFELIRPKFGLESNGFRYDRSIVIIILIKYFFQEYENKSNNFEWWKVSHCCDIRTKFLLQWYSWNRKYLLLQRRKQSNDILKNLCYRLVMRLWHEVRFLNYYEFDPSYSPQIQSKNIVR